MGCISKLTSIFTRRYIGNILPGDGARLISLTSSTNRISNTPSDTEVALLKSKYPEPKELLNKLFQPLVEGDPKRAPAIQFNEEYNGQVWNAKLQIQWPHAFFINGVHSKLSQAEENVYLLACQLLFKAGLIQRKGGEAVPLCEAEVMRVIENLTSSWDLCSGSATNFRIVTTQKRIDGEKAWQSEIKLTWPIMMNASGESSLLKSAQYEACLKSFIKLKIHNLLDADNNLQQSKVLKFKTGPIVNGSRSDFSPEFEIYVDASAKGYGAYLLNKEDHHVHWISEPWPVKLNQFDNLPLAGMCSGFQELYAVVAACYTWKHKFCDKPVLCWTDNQHVVEIVNKGIYFCHKNKKNLKYCKLYIILRNTCKKYNIRLNVSHVRRLDNKAADLLSRFKVDEFREIVPAAKSKSKKTKKLLFWEPIGTLNSPPPITDEDFKPK